MTQSTPLRVRSNSAQRRAAALLVIVCAAALSLAGCVAPEIDRQYGQPNGGSVNGTEALSRMFKKAGHNVVTKRILSPRVMENADVIVWFPASHSAPGEEVTDWFDEWFVYGSDRRLIYIDREFDAGALYWEKILPMVAGDKEKESEVRRRRNEVNLDIQMERQNNKIREECDWFVVDSTVKGPGKVTTLNGPWSEGIDASKAEIEINRLIEPKGVSFSDVLLESEGDIIAARISRDYWDDGEAVFVAGGSFLLNLPLVNHEHRKLAAKMINELDEPSDVVFLVSNSYSDPPVYDHEPAAEMPSSLGVFSMWPLGFILIHLSVAGVIFCFSRWTIFGRPRRPEPVALSDFGKHIAALGSLLAKTKEQEFALDKLRHYRSRKTKESSPVAAADTGSRRS